MKPATHTSSYGTSVGMAWEIYRSANLTMDGRIVDVYTKGGSIGSYQANLCLIPDYDIVVTMLSGGSEFDAVALQLTLTQILKDIIPAVEQAGKVEAQRKIAGTFSDAATNSSITLAVDDGPGLIVNNWTVRGVDVAKAYMAFGTDSTPQDATASAVIRLYPAGLSSGKESSWRAAFYTFPPDIAAAAEANIFYPQASCVTWSQLDGIDYGYNAIDDMVLTADNSGAISAVTSRFFRVTMALQSRPRRC
jgi:hypothetical protein